MRCPDSKVAKRLNMGKRRYSGSMLCLLSEGRVVVVVVVVVNRTTVVVYLRGGSRWGTVALGIWQSRGTGRRDPVKLRFAPSTIFISLALLLAESERLSQVQKGATPSSMTNVLFCGKCSPNISYQLPMGLTVPNCKIGRRSGHL